MVEVDTSGTDSGVTGARSWSRRWRARLRHDVRAVEVGVDVLDDAGDPHLRDDVVLRVVVARARSLGGLQPAATSTSPFGTGAFGFADQPRTTGMALSPTSTGVTTQ